MDFLRHFYDRSTISAALVPDTGQISFSICLSLRRTVNLGGYEISHARGDESFSNWNKKTLGADAKPSAARRQAYELPKNYTPVNFIVGSEDEESGKRYRAKIYIDRFSRGPPSPPVDAVAGEPAAPNGVTLKKRRAEIIPDNHHYMQRPAQSSTQYQTVSGMRRLQRPETEDRYEKEKETRVTPVV